MPKIKITSQELELTCEIGALKIGTFQIVSQNKDMVIIEMEKNEESEARQRCLDAVLEKGLGGKNGTSWVSPLGEKIEGLADAFYIGIKDQ